MKLFHTPRTRSLRVLWALEEIGLDCEVVPTVMSEPTPEFVALNPSRTMPVFVDGDHVITESVAALLYLATAKGPTPLAVSPSEADYADFLQFAVLGEAGLAAPLNALVFTRFRAPEAERRNVTVDAIEEGFFRRLQLVERRLEGREFIAADRFTIADISVGYILGLATGFLGFGDRLPKIATDYLQRLTERPAYQRAAAR